MACSITSFAEREHDFGLKSALDEAKNRYPTPEKCTILPIFTPTSSLRHYIITDFITLYQSKFQSDKDKSDEVMMKIHFFTSLCLFALPICIL